MKTKKFSVIVSVIALSIAIFSCTTIEREIAPEEIEGEWQTVVGDWEYIEFTIQETENYIYSYSVQRIMAEGTWELKGNTLTINDEANGSQKFKLKLENDTLYFNNGVQKYVRPSISQTFQQFEEDSMETSTQEEYNIEPSEFLKSMTSKFDFAFSEITSFQEEWLTDGTGWQTVSLSRKFRDDISEMGNTTEIFIEYLTDDGFQEANEFSTEIISGYRKGNIVVLVRGTTVPEPTMNDSYTIDLICGKVIDD